MKNHFLNIAILLLAVYALCACSSSDDVTETPPAKKDSWTLVIANQTTRGLELSDNTNTLTPTWETGDEIHVYYGDTKVGVLNPKEDVAETSDEGVQFVGNLGDASYTEGQTLSMYYRRDKTDEPVFTGQDGTIDDIAARYDFAVAEPTITAVDEVNKIITVETADFQSEEAIIRFKFDKALAANDQLTVSALDLNPISGTAGLVKSTATVTLKSAVAANNPVYVAIPVDGVSSYYEVIVTRSGQDIYTGGKANKTLYNGKYYSVTIALDDKWQLWAGGPAFRIKNLGADKVTDGGLYYAWGDTQGYYPATDSHLFNKSTYKWWNGTYYTKYISKTDTYNDGLFFLDSDDDAATQSLGNTWRMLEGEKKKYEDGREVGALVDKLDDGSIIMMEFLGDNKYHGGNGVLLRGTGSYINNIIFLPYAGYYDENEDGDDISYFGIECNFWTTGRYGKDSGCCFYVSHHDGEDLEYDTYQDNRWAGLPIRPVQTVTTNP